MCSKTQSASPPRRGAHRLLDRARRWRRGSRARRARARAPPLAPMMSSAGVSDASTGWPSRSPSTSGRMPSGSRKPITASGESSTAANAPRIRDIVSTVASRRLPGCSAISAQMTSVSDVESRCTPRATQLVAQLGGVREVAVVPERDGAAATVRARSAASSARWPSRSSSSACGRSRRRRRARLQLGLVEHLRHEPHLAQRGHAPSVGDRDPGALLAAVLQRVHPEVGEPRDVAARARRCRRRRTSARAPSPAAARSRRTRAHRRARRRRRTTPARTTMRSPPSRPSSTTGTPWRRQISSSRSRPAGAQVTSTLPQASPNSVMSPRSASAGSSSSQPLPTRQAELDRPRRPARRPRRRAPRRAARSRAASPSAANEAGELGQRGIGDATRRHAVLERLPLAAVVRRAPPPQEQDRRAPASRGNDGTASSARSSTPTAPTTGVGWIGEPECSL